MRGKGAAYRPPLPYINVGKYGVVKIREKEPMEVSEPDPKVMF